MKKISVVLLSLALLATAFPFAIGCNSGNSEASQRGQEEVRKQHMDRAEKMRQETKRTK